MLTDAPSSPDRVSRVRLLIGLGFLPTCVLKSLRRPISNSFTDIDSWYSVRSRARQQGSEPPAELRHSEPAYTAGPLRVQWVCTGPTRLLSASPQIVPHPAVRGKQAHGKWVSARYFRVVTAWHLWALYQPRNR